MTYHSWVNGETRLDVATPEQLMHMFLLKTCPEVYDPESEHFADTPKRFTRMFQEMTDGTENFNFTTFAASGQELIVIKDIRFISVCAHHLAPFSGVCHVGYIPEQVMAGISKFARHVRAYAHTLTNQETLTTNIASSLDDILDPKGLGVVMRASHSCMSVRGALAHGTETVTHAMRGVFLDHTRTAKSEFMSIVYGNGHA